ncbi:hypothetical protein ACLBWS_17275 [Brucellaceae bacterium D45D]
MNIEILRDQGNGFRQHALTNTESPLNKPRLSADIFGQVDDDSLPLASRARDIEAFDDRISCFQGFEISDRFDPWFHFLGVNLDHIVGSSRFHLRVTGHFFD